MEEVVLVSGARTPQGKFMGALSTVPAPELGAIAIKEAVKRAGIEPKEVDYVIMGNVIAAGLGQVPARQAGIKAGIPPTTSALTINKACASGMTAVVLGAHFIQLGEAQTVAAGGMENMSLAPHLLKNSRSGIRMGTGELVDSMIYDGLWCPFHNYNMGHAAETIATKYEVTRREQDEFAIASHRKAMAATKGGAFRAEIVPVTVKQRRETITVSDDEGPRADTSLEALAKLPAAFPPGTTVTAGNSSQITDGAAALIAMSARRAQERGLKPLARIIGYSHAGNDPHWLFDAPVPAVQTLLKQIGARLEDFDLIESNEAFAAQVMANGKALGWDWDRLNIKGGAVALGHPIGASGARILVTLLHSLKERHLKKGLAMICHAGGGAAAMAVEML